MKCSWSGRAWKLLQGSLYNSSVGGPPGGAVYLPHVGLGGQVGRKQGAGLPWTRWDKKWSGLGVQEKRPSGRAPLTGYCSGSFCQYHGLHLSPRHSLELEGICRNRWLMWRKDKVEKAFSASYNSGINYTRIAVCLIPVAWYHPEEPQHSLLHSTQSRVSVLSTSSTPCLLCELYLSKCLEVRPFLVSLSKWSKGLK